MSIKSLKYVSIVIAFLLISCSELFESEKDYSSIYFPLEEGNIWYYCRLNADSNNLIIRKVNDSFRRNDKIYYHWTDEEGSSFGYPIRADQNGNILLLEGSEEYLWFDFSQDSGSIYQFGQEAQFDDKDYNYTVHVLSKNATIDVPAGTFYGCMTFLFDIPQVCDEEIYYAFAPHVGIIYIGYDGWYSIGLKKAVVNGNSIEK